jgi:glycosyltransferase involved in cell wall biosynthesis
MRILWDLRLFSYGYRDRGVGTYVCAMARAIGERGMAHDIIAWANKGDVPDEVAAIPKIWIRYGGGSWQSDLARIPLLAARYNINVFHYWMAMGPVFRIGMGMFPPCRTMATVYDLGVEYNPGDPYCAHARSTWYWRMQKSLLRRVDAVSCISRTTKDELTRFLGGTTKRIDVMYPPVKSGEVCEKSRETVFVTLAGAPHKNLVRVIEAFALFRQTHGSYKLAVLGDTTGAGGLPEGVTAGPMRDYDQLLDTCAGLVACSTYEGLGIPPLEAMAHGCPILVSDIAPLHETCDGAARFANPLNPRSIAEGMRDIASNQESYVKKSKLGFVRYRAMTVNAGGQWEALYEALSPAHQGSGRKDNG